MNFVYDLGQRPVGRRYYDGRHSILLSVEGWVPSDAVPYHTGRMASGSIRLETMGGGCLALVEGGHQYAVSVNLRCEIDEVVIAGVPPAIVGEVSGVNTKASGNPFTLRFDNKIECPFVPIGGADWVIVGYTHRIVPFRAFARMRFPTVILTRPGFGNVSYEGL